MDSTVRTYWKHSDHGLCPWEEQQDSSRARFPSDTGDVGRMQVARDCSKDTWASEQEGLSLAGELFS